MLLEDKVQNLIKNKQIIKLHLGCGPVIMDGYINVDGDYMKDNPDVTIHDITKTFPLPDNCVDEILSVHVIEHIMPNELPEVFKEWRRILKPTGCVITEWPDLLKMCKFLVEDPSRLYSKDRRVLKRGVAGIFGNIGRYKDPVMLHKWGYSEQSLCVLFKECGYSKAHGQTPIHPKTEMCSSVIAYK